MQENIFHFFCLAYFHQKFFPSPIPLEKRYDDIIFFIQKNIHLGHQNDQLIECVLQNLIEQPTTSSLSYITFFNLAKDQKAALILVDLQKWSYARCANLLKISLAEFKKLLWSTRMLLASSKPFLNGKPFVDCPNWDIHAPWIQEYLDQEIDLSSDRLKVEKHLLHCVFCSEAFKQYYQVYFQSSKITRQLLNQEALKKDFSIFMQKYYPQGWQEPSTSIKKGIKKLFYAPDVQWFLYFFSLFLIVLFIFSTH